MYIYIDENEVLALVSTIDRLAVSMFTRAHARNQELLLRRLVRVALKFHSTHVSRWHTRPPIRWGAVDNCGATCTRTHRPKINVAKG